MKDTLRKSANSRIGASSLKDLNDLEVHVVANSAFFEPADNGSLQVVGRAIAQSLHIVLAFSIEVGVINYFSLHIDGDVEVIPFVRGICAHPFDLVSDNVAIIRNTYAFKQILNLIWFRRLNIRIHIWLREIWGGIALRTTRS